MGVDLAGDKDRRNRIEKAGTDAREQVGRARTAGGHGNSRPVAHPSKAVHREGRRLFVVHADDPQPAPLVHRVQEVGDHAANDLEDDIHSPGGEVISYVVGCLHASRYGEK